MWSIYNRYYADGKFSVLADGGNNYIVLAKFKLLTKIQIVLN